MTETVRPTTESLDAAGWSMVSRCTDPGDHKRPSRFDIVLAFKGKEYRTEYSQGSAHRAWSDNLHPAWRKHQDHKHANELAKYLGNTETIRKGSKVDNWGTLGKLSRLVNEKHATNAIILRTFAEMTEPTPPDLANVLYCLVSDAQCAQGTFSDFCSSLGYDEDSRKAFDNYLACQKTLDYLTRCGAGFDALCEMFHDF